MFDVKNSFDIIVLLIERSDNPIISQIKPTPALLRNREKGGLTRRDIYILD